MDLPEKDDWKLHKVDPTCWDEYIATRPVYDARIFDRVDEYQTTHSLSRQAALDIGTGSGSAIGPLIQRFDHVVASDNDAVSLSFTRQRFSELPPDRLSYTLSRGEELLQHHAPSSFDLITCAETFPLTDPQMALHNISILLRPGGTVAIWFYGPPFFIDADISSACQPVLDAIMDHNFRPLVSGGDQSQKKTWKRAADGEFSWLDYIPFPAEQWQDVRRHKWNTGARLSFFTPEACDFPVEPISRVGKHDKVTEEQNPKFWQVSWDLEKLRSFVTASFPKPGEMAGPDDKMDKMFEQLADAMGGSHVTVKLSWPAVLILASKNLWVFPSPSGT